MSSTCFKRQTKQNHGPHRYTYRGPADRRILMADCLGFQQIEDVNSWEAFFHNFSYKPNFTIEYEYRIDYNEHWLSVDMMVLDSRGSGREVRISARPILDPWYDEEFALYFTNRVLEDMELHELHEWVRYKGALINDPHKKDPVNGRV